MTWWFVRLEHCDDLSRRLIWSLEVGPTSSIWSALEQLDARTTTARERWTLLVYWWCRIGDQSLAGWTHHRWSSAMEKASGMFFVSLNRRLTLSYLAVGTNGASISSCTFYSITFELFGVTSILRSSALLSVPTASGWSNSLSGMWQTLLQRTLGPKRLSSSSTVQERSTISMVSLHDRVGRVSSTPWHVVVVWTSSCTWVPVRFWSNRNRNMHFGHPCTSMNMEKKIHTSSKYQDLRDGGDEWLMSQARPTPIFGRESLKTPPVSMDFIQSWSTGASMVEWSIRFLTETEVRLKNKHCSI